MNPNNNQADWSASEEIGCGARRGNVVRSAALSGGWWRDVGAEVVVVGVAAAGVVVAVGTESS